MKRNLASLLFILIFTPFIFSFGQTTHLPEKYSKVRIFSSSPFEIEKMSVEGLHIDHALRKHGFIEVWLSAEEIAMLKKSGAAY